MELFQWSLLLPVTISTLLCVITAVEKCRRIRRLRLPPGPTPLPIVGNLFLLAGDPHRALANLAKVHGPVMTLELGLTTTIIVSSPHAAREVLQAKDQWFSSRTVPDVVNGLNYHAEISVVFQSTTPLWKQLRAICVTNLLNSRCLDSGRWMRQEKVRQLVAFFRAHAGRPLDFGCVTFGTILNVLSNTVFSFDMADLNSESTNQLRDLVSAITEVAGKPNISDFFPVLRFLDLQGRRRAYRVLSGDFLSRVDEIIDRRLSSKADAAARSDDFLDHLLRLHTEAKLDRKAIRSLLGDLFVAGTDTTTITLVWAMAELQRNPSAVAKARAELQEVIGDDEVEESDIDKLPYLQAVIKEVLRLHPPASLLPHKAKEDGVELGGYSVPKDTKLLVNVWAIGRDERFWPEAEVFKPERFLGKDVDVKGHDFELIPFGSGRRSCPGMPLAMRTSQLALAALLHGFEWRLPEGMEPGDVDLREKFGFTLTMAVPLRVVALPVHRKKPVKD